MMTNCIVLIGGPKKKGLRKLYLMAVKGWDNLKDISCNRERRGYKDA